MSISRRTSFPAIHLTQDGQQKQPLQVRLLNPWRLSSKKQGPIGLRLSFYRHCTSHSGVCWKPQYYFPSWWHKCYYRTEQCVHRRTEQRWKSGWEWGWEHVERGLAWLVLFAWMAETRVFLHFWLSCTPPSSNRGSALFIVYGQYCIVHYHERSGA